MYAENKENPPLPIQIGNRKLQDSRKRNPREIRDVGECDPLVARIDDDERPYEGAEDREDVERGEQVVLEAELDRREGEIEDEVERKRERDRARHFFFQNFPENESKRDRDDRVQNCPNRPKEPRGRRPRGLHECCIPQRGIHGYIVPHNEENPRAVKLTPSGSKDTFTQETIHSGEHDEVGTGLFRLSRDDRDGNGRNT